MNADKLLSLYGPLRSILVPGEFASPENLGRAICAWHYHLTPKEIALMELLSEGITREQIGVRMGNCSTETIKTALSALYTKLRVARREQVVRIAAFYGFARKPDASSPPTE